MGSTEQILGVALGTLLMALLRALNKRRFWRRVAQSAANMLADPANPADTPVAAAEKALAEAQQHQVIQIARTITDSQRITVGRTPSNLIDRPFEKRTRTPDTDPRGYQIGPRKPPRDDNE